MKKRVILMLESVALASLLAGCASHDNAPPPADPDAESRVDAAVINAVSDSQLADALVAEHTLYPYHFVANGSELNELGQRDLDVLAGFYKTHPGELSIRNGGLSDDLAKARTRGVEEALIRDGVDTSRVKLTDANPGGPGMESDTVVKILDKNTKDMMSAQGYPDSSTGIGISGGSSGGGSK